MYAPIAAPLALFSLSFRVFLVPARQIHSYSRSGDRNRGREKNSPSASATTLMRLQPLLDGICSLSDVKLRKNEISRSSREQPRFCVLGPANVSNVVSSTLLLCPEQKKTQS